MSWSGGESMINFVSQDEKLQESPVEASTRLIEALANWRPFLIESRFSAGRYGRVGSCGVGSFCAGGKSALYARTSSQRPLRFTKMSVKAARPVSSLPS